MLQEVNFPMGTAQQPGNPLCFAKPQVPASEGVPSNKHRGSCLGEVSKQDPTCLPFFPSQIQILSWKMRISFRRFSVPCRLGMEQCPNTETNSTTALNSPFNMQLSAQHRSPGCPCRGCVSAVTALPFTEF